MPELPEVEIVRQSLDKKIRQKKVKKVIIRNQNLRIKVPNYFKRFFENKIIIKVKRFSKYLIVYLQNNKFCLIHLGMSGTIHLLDNKKKGTSTNLSFSMYPNVTTAPLEIATGPMYNSPYVIGQSFDYDFVDPDTFVSEVNRVNPDYPHTHTIAAMIKSTVNELEYVGSEMQKLLRAV